MRGAGPITLTPAAPSGVVELVTGREHFERVVIGGMLQAKVSLDIATADFKAMMVPVANQKRGAESIVSHLVKLADKGVEVRLLHAGVPSEPTLRVLRQFYRRAGVAGDGVRGRITIRRCPRLHAKAVIVDAAAMYLGSANLTGAGLGAKVEANRNFEWGIWTESSELIDGVLDHLNRLWEGEHCEGCGRKDVCPVPLEEPRLG
jgi:phosphatidylserine/phosphatidylglycerophosphate/cardiolipin synthase-like enzyme